MKRSILLLLLAVLLAVFSGCSKRDPGSVTIAEQYGLAYAPVQIARIQGLIEKRVPNAEVNWVQLGNTAAIREAIVAGRVDIGFGAIPPFLIGWENGMKWKIATGLSQAPIGLVAIDPKLNTLSDFTVDDRIALPQPGSIQHILLSMALERETGDAGVMDDSLVTLAHPDGVNALLSGSVAAHFTSPPYIYKELEQPGAHVVISGDQAMGEPFTFIVGYATDSFHEREPSLYQAFVEAMEEASQFITEHPDDAARQLAELYGIDADTLKEYLTADGMIYGPEILGVEAFADFMVRNGYLERSPKSLAEIMWE